jgi:hypothetical protein
MHPNELSIYSTFNLNATKRNLSAEQVNINYFYNILCVSACIFGPQPPFGVKSILTSNNCVKRILPFLVQSLNDSGKPFHKILYEKFEHSSYLKTRPSMVCFQPFLNSQLLIVNDCTVNSIFPYGNTLQNYTPTNYN